VFLIYLPMNQGLETASCYDSVVLLLRLEVFAPFTTSTHSEF